jgi:hypothetical protein
MRDSNIPFRFDDAAMVKDKAGIAHIQRTQPVGNHDGGASCHKALHGLHDQGFRLYINGTCGLIQNEQGRIFWESAAGWRDMTKHATRSSALHRHKIFRTFCTVYEITVHQAVVAELKAPSQQPQGGEAADALLALMATLPPVPSEAQSRVSEDIKGHLYPRPQDTTP